MRKGTPTPKDTLNLPAVREETLSQKNFFLRHLKMPRTILEQFRRFHSSSSRCTSRSAVCPLVDASSRQENDIGDRRVKSQNLLRHSEVEQLGLRWTAPAPPVEKGHAARDVRRVRESSGGGSAKGPWYRLQEFELMCTIFASLDTVTPLPHGESASSSIAACTKGTSR